VRRAELRHPAPSSADGRKAVFEVEQAPYSFHQSMPLLIIVNVSSIAVLCRELLAWGGEDIAMRRMFRLTATFVCGFVLSQALAVKDATAEQVGQARVQPAAKMHKGAKIAPRGPAPGVVPRSNRAFTPNASSKPTAARQRGLKLRAERQSKRTAPRIVSPGAMRQPVRKAPANRAFLNSGLAPIRDSANPRT
jgi:hypothetical protein